MNTRGGAQVVDKDQADRNRAKQVKIYKIARIIRGQTVRVVLGRSNGSWSVGTAGDWCGRIYRILIGLRMVEDSHHK